MKKLSCYMLFNILLFFNLSGNCVLSNNYKINNEEDILEYYLINEINENKKEEIKNNKNNNEEDILEYYLINEINENKKEESKKNIDTNINYAEKDPIKINTIKEITKEDKNDNNIKNSENTQNEIKIYNDNCTKPNENYKKEPYKPNLKYYYPAKGPEGFIERRERLYYDLGLNEIQLLEARKLDEKYNCIFNTLTNDIIETKKELCEKLKCYGTNEEINELRDHIKYDKEDFKEHFKKYEKQFECILTKCQLKDYKRIKKECKRVMKDHEKNMKRHRKECNQCK